MYILPGSKPNEKYPADGVYGTNKTAHVLINGIVCGIYIKMSSHTEMSLNFSHTQRNYIIKQNIYSVLGIAMGIAIKC